MKLKTMAITGTLAAAFLGAGYVLNRTLEVPETHKYCSMQDDEFVIVNARTGSVYPNESKRIKEISATHCTVSDSGEFIKYRIK